MPCLRSMGLLRPMAGLALASALLGACANGGTADDGMGGSGAGGSSTGGEKGSGGAASGDNGSGGNGSGGNGSGGSTGGGGHGSGGSISTGGAPGTGGVSGSGGATASGGVSGSGGATGTGGKGTGGTPGTGGGTGGAGATGGVGSGTCGGGAAQSSDVTINESSLQQKITGFGVSSAWAGSYANASDPDYLWSTTTGAGLTLLRIRYGDGLTIAKAAVKAGVTVWMTPWGTGTNGATGGSDTTTETANGCKTSVPVLTNPQGLAASLVSWVQNAKSQGVPLYAVSAENEPDSCGINSTTSYSAAQLAAWIDVLGPAMAAIGVKVMAPETQNACGFTSYYSAIHSDSAAWNAVSIFASHEYGCGTLPSEPAIAAADKEYWETEVDTGTASGDSSGDGIASALLMGQTMHNDLTKANLNAWHLWWLYEGGNTGGCLYDTGSKVWTKRLWVMGNYSRFVRPGWVRVATSGTSPSGVLVSAYINPANNALSIVAINNNTSSSNVSFYVSGAAPCSLTPYETSASKSLGQGSAVSVSQSRVSVTLSAQSVTTFVGMP